MVPPPTASRMISGVTMLPREVVYVFVERFDDEWWLRTEGKQRECVLGLTMSCMMGARAGVFLATISSSG